MSRKCCCLRNTFYAEFNYYATRPPTACGSFSCIVSGWNCLRFVLLVAKRQPETRHCLDRVQLRMFASDARQERLQSINFLSLDDFLALKRSANRKQSGKSFMNSRRLNEVALPHFIPAPLINALDVGAVIKLLPHLFYVHRLVCAIACHFSRESFCRWCGLAARDKQPCQGSTNIKRDYAAVKRTMEASSMKI